MLTKICKRYMCLYQFSYCISFLSCICSLIDRDTKLKYEAQFEKYEETHCGGYRRIYPLKENEERYQKYFNQNTSLCTETIASRARADMARQLREQVETKRKELEK